MMGFIFNIIHFLFQLYRSTTEGEKPKAPATNAMWPKFEDEL